MATRAARSQLAARVRVVRRAAAAGRCAQASHEFDKLARRLARGTRRRLDNAVNRCYANKWGLR